MVQRATTSRTSSVELDDSTRLAIAEAQFGIEVEHFRASDVGRFILGRADSEIEFARDELEKVDPNDARAVQAVQNRVAVARLITGWLDEAVRNGRIAESQLRQAEENY